MKKYSAVEKINEAWDYIWNKEYSPETNVIYDVPYKTYSFPTPEEVTLSLPNACGWSTGMEDGMISAGNMLSVIVNRYSVEKDESLHEYAANVLKGIYRCAKVSGERGFLARSVHPNDKSCFYIDSSRDQYTMVVFGLYNYYNSPLCTDEDKAQIVELMEDFSYRAINNIKAENDWHYLRADGKIGIVDKMWEVDGHEFLRLPMIYLVTYHVTKNELYLKHYRELADKAIEASFSFGNVQSHAILHQMQVSARCLFELDTDKAHRQKLSSLMQKVAERGVKAVQKNLDMYKSGELSLNNPAPDWRSCFFMYDLRRPVGDKGYFVPWYPEAYRFGDVFSVMNSFSSVSIQALCPDFEVEKKDIECMKEVLELFDFEKFAARTAPYILETYWLLKTQDLI